MPVIEMYPSTEQTISRGASALFQCRVTRGIPSPSITWTRASGDAMTDSTEIFDGNGVIQFTSASGDEQGSYVCTATNAAGSASATAKLVVKGTRLRTCVHAVDTAQLSYHSSLRACDVLYLQHTGTHIIPSNFVYNVTYDLRILARDVFVQVRRASASGRRASVCTGASARACASSALLTATRCQTSSCVTSHVTWPRRGEMSSR